MINISHGALVVPDSISFTVLHFPLNLILFSFDISGIRQPELLRTRRRKIIVLVREHLSHCDVCVLDVWLIVTHRVVRILANYNPFWNEKRIQWYILKWKLKNKWVLCRCSNSQFTQKLKLKNRLVMTDLDSNSQIITANSPGYIIWQRHLIFWRLFCLAFRKTCPNLATTISASYQCQCIINNLNGNARGQDSIH